MELNTLKTEAKELMMKNRVKKAFQLLTDHLNTNELNYNNFISLSRRFNNLTEQSLTNTIGYEQESIESSKIDKALLYFIDSLAANDINDKDKLVHHELDNRIIVFTQIDNISRLERFFRQLNFSNAIVKSLKYIDIDEINNSDLVIFDNRDLDNCGRESEVSSLDIEHQTLIKERIECMDDIIKNTSKFIIHFGNQFYWINSNRDRVQASNSQFSLYSRIKEVIEFINTYRI